MKPAARKLDVFRGDDRPFVVRLWEADGEGGRIPLDVEGAAFELEFAGVTKKTSAGSLTLSTAGGITELRGSFSPTDTDRVSPDLGSTYSLVRTDGPRGRRTLLTGSLRGLDAPLEGNTDVGVDLTVLDGEVVIEVEVTDSATMASLALDAVQALRDQAAASQSAAAGSATAASQSATDAAAERTQAQTARTGAETARTGAETAAGAASTSKTGAEAAATEADADRVSAINARTAAETARNEAQDARDDALAAAVGPSIITRDWDDLQGNTTALRAEHIRDDDDPTRVGLYGRTVSGDPLTPWIKDSPATTASNDVRLTVEIATREALVKKSDRSQFKRISRDARRFVGGSVAKTGRRAGVYSGPVKGLRAGHKMILRDSRRFVGGTLKATGSGTGLYATPFKIATRDGYRLIARDGRRFVGGAVTEDGERLGIYGGSSSSEETSTPDPAYVQGASVKDAWWSDPNVVAGIIGNGQSNIEAVNSDISDALIASTALYPGYAFMPGTGLRLTTGTFTALVPLVEIAASGRRETFMSGCVNHLIQKVHDNVGVWPEIVGMISALTAQTWQNLGRGSPQYAATLNGVRSVVNILKPQGKRFVVIAAVYGQGEAQKFIAIANRQREMMQYARQIDADIRAITGQSEPVISFMPAVGSGTQTDMNDADFIQAGPPLALGRFEEHPLIRVPGPHYPMPISSDNLHLACIGQNRQGQMIARAIYDETAGTGWTEFRSRRYYWRSSTVLDMEVSTPSGLDVALVDGEDVTDTAATTKGFQISALDALLAFSVSIPASPDPANVPKRIVRFTFSAPVTAGSIRITYANRSDGPGNGPIQGARGCVADALQEVSLYDGHPNRNWMLPLCDDVAGP